MLYVKVRVIVSKNDGLFIYDVSKTQMSPRGFFYRRSKMTCLANCRALKH